MAEGKQYVARALDKGSVQISEDVIAAVIAHAVGEVDGVSCISTKPGAEIAEFIGKKNWGKGLKITVTDENVVSIDCNITVNYGQHVVDIANVAQQAIISAVKSLAEIEIGTVNVTVCGIARQ